MASFLGKMLVIQKNFIPLHSLNKRALSSAGLEHLPYKQRVGGSNPSSPTKKRMCNLHILFCCLHLTDAYIVVVSEK